ncbi:MAG: formate dehydrogenase accessory protein FdhE [Proteobacteria bacterium]|nr:formate dehydrogenase accessory protein FdhE [Pseudomonadota bacterium]MBU1611889.1 formate dehydrogenase accessory protein FdhE [Pseudomonadota bacterium]
MEHDITPIVQRLDAKLAHLKGKQYLPESLVELLGDVARLQLTAQAKAVVEIPTQFPEAEDVLKGRALVDRERFPYDRPQATELLLRFLDLIKKNDGALAEAGQVIATALDKGEIESSDLFVRVLEDDAEFFGSWAERMPQAPQTLYFLTYAALAPSLAAAAVEMADYLPDATSWAAGTCPICGGLPLISRLEDKEGVRLATCSFCAHEYRVRRLACAICGESDLNKLTYFTVAEEPGFRVDVCTSCKTYIKTIDFRAMDRTVLPAFDDLDSLALDFVAREQGYSRPTLSAWGF